jgi:hypothetical protein
MCEILVCVKDRGNILNPDPAQYHRAPKQGDVIAVQADGWAWGACELGLSVDGNPNGNHDFFRLIKLPNVTVAQVSRMLAPEKDVDPLNPSPYLQYRAFYFDKTKIPNQLMRNYWNDDTRSAPFLTLPFNITQINNIVSQRPAIPFAGAG